MVNDRDNSGRWPDGVETRPAHLDRNDEARRQLADFGVPVLDDGKRTRLFVACFDGTWNDKDKFPDEKTNVADIYEQIRKVARTDVKAGYQSGVGTQDSDFIKNLDGAAGYSYGPRMEEMYLKFIRQAKEWKQEDPNAEISVASMGFSRGGPTAAMFTRMVHERGIQNPDGMTIERDAQGNIQSLTPTRPNLVPPGETKQALGLFDPVATGMMNLVDVRPPPSVVTGFQINASDELRDPFQLKQILDPGLSADGRFLSVWVPGAHCDIGGSYRLNGLSLRNGNMMMSYLNALSETPFLRERPVPTAPEMNVIHRSDQHESYYFKLAADFTGERQATERLIGPSPTAAVALLDLVRNTDNPEPVDERLRNGLRYRAVPIAPEREDPTLPAFFRDRPLPAPSVPMPGVVNRLSVEPAPNYVVPGEAPQRTFGVPDYLQPGMQRPRPEEIPTLDPVRATLPDIDKPARTGALSRMPNDHPDYPLFLSIKERLPNAPDDMLAYIALEAKKGHVKAEEISGFAVIDDVVHIQGRFPGQRASVPTGAGAPPLEDTLRSSQVYDQQQSQWMAQNDAMRITANDKSPVMA